MLLPSHSHCQRIGPFSHLHIHRSDQPLILWMNKVAFITLQWTNTLHNNPAKPCRLQMDPAWKVLCCLASRWAPNLFHKHLHPFQKPYVFIKLGALAVLCSVEEIHHFCGKKFLLETYHILLERILAKILKKAILTFEWPLMGTLPHSFYVKYYQRATNQLAGCLSQLGPIDNYIKVPIVQVSEIISHLHATAKGLELLREATTKDDELALHRHVAQ